MEYQKNYFSKIPTRIRFLSKRSFSNRRQKDDVKDQVNWKLRTRVAEPNLLEPIQMRRRRRKRIDFLLYSMTEQ